MYFDPRATYHLVPNLKNYVFFKLFLVVSRKNSIPFFDTLKNSFKNTYP
jgi:hypothetical protein